jgi:hypothetical protein
MPIITNSFPPPPERPLFVEAQIILTHERVHHLPSELAEAIINQVVDSVRDHFIVVPITLRRILETVPGYGQGSREIVLESVTGYLSCQGVFQGQNHFWQGGIRPLNQITAQEINNLTFRAQESNNLQWYELLWKFHIVTLSLQQGGDPKVKPPRWAPQLKFRETWSGHEGVNCAAFAIVYMMYGTHRRYSRSLSKALRDAKSLMLEIGWDVTCTLADLKKFTDKYQKYRLTVILPYSCDSPFSFTGKEYDGNKVYMLYLVYDPNQRHFAATKSPQEIYMKTKGENSRWCHICTVRYSSSAVHTCVDGAQVGKKKIQLYKCLKCGELGKHTCPLISCKSCAEFYKRGEVHRCIVFMEKKNPENNKFFQDGDDEDGKYPALWVYDLESRIQIKETSQRVITEFLFEENGKYYYRPKQDESISSVCVYNHTIQEHKANLVVLKNVFKPEESRQWFGDSAVQDFILFITNFNKGNNICLAHNASGYDTRILFSGCKDLNQRVDMFPIMRGGKFMQLTLNKNTVFRDSMLHVRGSIKSLAKDFCDGLLEKGYFPHLFNTTENYGYVGPIPDKKYFDLSFSCRSEKDFSDFHTWHDSWEGDWNFMDQLVLYCKNDVDVLGVIVKKYHEISENSFGISPWHNATAPSYVHEVFLRKLGEGLNLPLFKTNPEDYKNRINDLAWNHFWAVLKPCEYWFARAALRGGRTDVRKLYHQVSQEDWARGVRIRYQDICSQYPYQQVVHDFPVGAPKIHVYDLRYHPCITHQKSREIVCDCVEKGYMRECKVTIDVPPSSEEIIAKNLFGIFCATVEPPKNIYHPVLIAYDEKLNKSVASCEILVEQFFTSVEFIKALQNGYKIIQLFRFDEYTRKPSLWRDVVEDLFIEKMVNSKNEPNDEQKVLMVQRYREKFGDVFAQKIQNSFTPDRWGKRPAQKQTAKIGMNSGWGKHAQRPIMEETLILGTSGSDGEIDSFFSNCMQNNFTYKDGMYLGSNMVMYKYVKDGPTTEPNLHKGYLPAALFVPAYGRLQLWEQMNKLGKRVLMNDTDSIIYVYDPDLYNIPEGGLLGEWEVEDIDTENGGIREFVGLGPKTYALKCDNGKELVKAKGLSLNLATSQLVNFNSMKQLAKTFLENYARDVFSSGVIKVPQKTFVWNAKDGMRTWLMLKDLKFNYNDVKGVMDGEGYLHPFGFSE